jgi:hypothetical protein
MCLRIGDHFKWREFPLDSLEQIGNNRQFGSRGKHTRFGAKTMDSDQKSAWRRRLDEECPYQVVLPRQQLADDSEILDFLIEYIEKFDMYVEDDYAAFVRYCFADPLDAEIFRSRFEPKGERFKLAGVSHDTGRRMLLRQRALRGRG